MVDKNKEYIASVEKILGVRFKNKQFLLTALTHSSYANEHKCQSNERLEFLGDSVLGLVISERLYGDQKLSAEGRLSQMRSRIVSEEPLAKVCLYLGLDKYLRVGVGEAKSQASRAMVADLVEAVIGAVYLDQGFKVTKKFILRHFEKLVIKIEQTQDVLDFKSQLQEKCVKQGVRYKTESSGEAHKLTFVSQVFVANKLCGTGEGTSKREAEKSAAQEALKNLENSQNNGLKISKKSSKNGQKYKKNNKQKVK